VVERAVLLDQDHDVLDVGERPAARRGGERALEDGVVERAGGEGGGRGDGGSLLEDLAAGDAVLGRGATVTASEARRQPSGGPSLPLDA
jgi:hypothetical protein